MLEFNIEDAQALKHHLEAFVSGIGREWESVIVQWQELRDSWDDSQCASFETSFENLSDNYRKLMEDIYTYHDFLQNKITESEKIAHLELPIIKKTTLCRWGTGEFTKNKVDQIPDDLKGIYYIHSPDIINSQEREVTLYVGRSERSIKNSLLCHLDNSNNVNLRKDIGLGQMMRFYWYESHDLSYEEELDITQMKRAGLFKSQDRRRNLIVEYLDSNSR